MIYSLDAVGDADGVECKIAGQTVTPGRLTKPIDITETRTTVSCQKRSTEQTVSVAFQTSSDAVGFVDMPSAKGLETANWEELGRRINSLGDKQAAEAEDLASRLTSTNTRLSALDTKVKGLDSVVSRHVVASFDGETWMENQKDLYVAFPQLKSAMGNDSNATAAGDRWRYTIPVEGDYLVSFHTSLNGVCKASGCFKLAYRKCVVMRNVGEVLIMNQTGDGTCSAIGIRRLKSGDALELMVGMAGDEAQKTNVRFTLALLR